jgi:hypothetical protein
MSVLLKPSWLSYTLTGALAILASWALTGCRFGNHQVDQAQQTDGVSGYYETQPQSMKYCATTASETCQNVGTNMIPADFTSILTNPVALKLQDASTGQAVLFSAFGGTTGIAIFANTDQSLSVVGTANAQLWDDPACTRTDQQLIEGAYTKTSGPWTSNTPTIPKSGRINLTITYTITLNGTCTTSLQAIAACYGDATKCGTHEQSETQDLFGGYISAGSMTAADIPNTTALAYEIVYQ